MQWLTALLAFATTMLIFAIIVSTFVELIHRIFGLRASGMQLMLESLYVREIEPRLTSTDRPDARTFAALIMENRAIMPDGTHQDRGKLSKLLHWLVKSSVVTNIPVEVFTQKLADNRIVSAVDDWGDDVTTDIAQKFTAFGNEASAYFESRARVFSIILAFLVAWLFFVQPYKLASTYFKNPEIAQHVADMSADVHSQYAVLDEKMSSILETKSVEAGTGDLKAAIEEVRATLEKAINRTEELAAIGVPVGWPDVTKLGACTWLDWSKDCTFTVFGMWIRPSIGNVFWLLVGGLLVGLGAPFWAQAVSSLSASRDVTNKLTEIVNPGRMPGTRGIGPSGTGQADSTALATFRAARAPDIRTKREAAEKAVAIQAAAEAAALAAAKPKK